MLIRSFLFLLAFGGAAWAHDHNHPEDNDWYKSLQNQSGVMCCDGSDAYSVEDPNWKMEDGGYKVMLNGSWIKVPNEALVTKYNKVGVAKVWPYYMNGDLTQIRCFLPGATG